MSMTAKRAIRVLCVDDSALIRKLVTEIVNNEDDMEMVATAPDPLVARELIKQHNPDVLTLDVEMPRMDGLDFLGKLMRLRPMPVIMLSSLTERGSDITLQALELGAVDFVTKPKLDLSRGLVESGHEIVEKIRGAARATLRRPTSRPAGAQPLVAPRVSSEKLFIVGASTGGFTDCLLQHGAAKVFAVDVGYGQLAWSLRQDPRVVNLERCNIRTLASYELPETPSLAVIDASFISLTLVIPKVLSLIADEGEVVALVKPQFEVGKGRVGKGGVVLDPALHAEVLTQLQRRADVWQVDVKGVIESSLRGAKGNREFLLYLQKR